MSRPQANKRDDLTGEHALGDMGQIMFGVLFLSIWIADSFFLKYTVFLNPIIPYPIRGLFGGMLLVAAGFFSLGGLKAVFIERRPEPHVISDGVFGIVRHPIYLGELLFYAGLMTLSISIAAGLVLIGTVSFIVFICQYEESLLLDRFGEAYRAYMQDVPMLLPGLGRRH